ncbi:MAG: valine--tRNA ligase [Erythrobacter sp.]|jgi:valyl-tRNA synthetase
MSTELSKTFDPAEIEARWYAHWEENGLFRPERPDAQPYTIVNPPPNVTGSLHIGHALDNTLQDVMIRYERLRGKDALWVVGTDHAGIATQMVVERQLEQQQDKRTNYSREDFVAKVWEWKEESGGTITRQLRRLGCSMDWSLNSQDGNGQFTMDPHFTRAVTKVFVDLYNDGLIYRDKRLVNWDPKLKTAISDLEVETHEVKGGFWHFKYPLADGVTTAEGKDHLVVATTRPETMLADMAVAVHPDDERYRSVVGKFVTLPITGRLVRIIADEHADPELGSGCVKITPGHDFNDFEVGKRAGFAPSQMYNMFDAEARVVQTADRLIPEEFLGLDRFDARKLVVERMKEKGFLVPHTDKDGNEHDAEPRVVATPFGDRGGVVIEPWLTDQWYVDAERLAKAPIEAVRSGAIEIVPKTWEKTFFNWMENIQPWCVSRQLWWGHRIPAWFGVKREVYEKPDFIPPMAGASSAFSEGHVIVSERDDASVKEAFAEYYGVSVNKVVIASEVADGWHYQTQYDQSFRVIFRDPDVLDTWFSSALWPFATLGWPDNTPSPLAGEGGAPSGAEGEGTATQVAADASNPSPNPLPQGERASLLARHYPNDLLISGFDILFFWDARMMMMGMYNTGQIPWSRLYLHGLVRAADGQKMSKSKGNVIDPLGLIDRYGADALRFFMCAMESQGRDIKMDDRRIEGYRNFATKLWNATRFCQANGIGASTSIAAPPARLAVNRWIIGEVVETRDALDKALADLRFDAAANAIYHFVWDRFCDWYLELVKPILADYPSPLQGRGRSAEGAEGVGIAKDSPHPPTPSPEREGGAAGETRAVAGWALDQILVMLHPFMPFITEELWHAQGKRPYELILAKWPETGASVDSAAKAEIDWLIALTSAVRTARNELGIAPGAKLEAYVASPSALGKRVIEANGAAIERLARLTPVHFAEAPAGAAIEVSAGEDAFLVPLEGVIDIAAEKARLDKALAASTREAKSLEARLSNASFVERAAPEAVEKARADHAHHLAEVARLEAALARLG